MQSVVYAPSINLALTPPKFGSTCDHHVKVKVKVWTLAIAPLTWVKTRDQQRFTISEVAFDWHEPMVPQRIMWPQITNTVGMQW